MKLGVETLKHELNGSQNATAIELQLSRSGVRRVLADLPLRPDEFETLTRWLRRLSAEAAA